MLYYSSVSLLIDYQVFGHNQKYDRYIMKKMADKPGRIFLAFLTIMIVSLISLQIILLRNSSISAETSSTQVGEVALTLTVTAKVTSEPVETMTPLVAEESTHEAVATQKATPIPSNADLRLGYIDRGLNCSLMSEISALVLEKQFALNVETIEYETLDDLFALLASTKESEKIDLTLCFLDPTDRSYISKYFGFTKQLGGAYWQNDSNKLLIMANASIVAPLEKEQPCIYNFFRQIRFNSDDFEDAIDASTWIQNNRAKIREWTACNAN